MALKPTIYKFGINIANLDTDHYDAINITVAQHPSENVERMMARVVAFTLNAQDRLQFSKGLDEPDDADIWLRDYDDSIKLWIDVGEPSADRLKRVGRLADTTKVYAFNSKADTWWSQIANKVRDYKVEVYQFNNASIEALAAITERTMQLSFTITGESAYIAGDSGDVEVTWVQLQ